MRMCHRSALTLLLPTAFCFLPGCGDSNSSDSVTPREVADAGPAVEDASTEAEVNTEPHEYDGQDPFIRHVGRIDLSREGQLRYNAPGVYVVARFLGDGVTLNLDDSVRWGSEPSYYDIVIDGEFVYKLEPEGPDQVWYPVPVELEPGEHTVEVHRRTEAAIGGTHFRGFRIDGELLEPPPAPDRKIEFVGDSITVGSGVEAKNNSAACSEGGWGQPYHNARLSYGAVAARALGADYHITGVSGIGLVRNYNSSNDRTMPIAYPEIDLAKSSDEWDPSLFRPDVIVTALGTNDFSPGDTLDTDDVRPQLEPEEHAAAYIEFIDRLRELQPQAEIVALSSVMLGDGWPDSSYDSATDLNTSLDLLEEHYADTDDKVHTLRVPRQAGSGCGTHPNAEQQAATGELVAEYLAELMDW